MSLRVKLRTTNAIERAFREVRRRTRPMSAFTNDASCERITYALVAHLNAQWSRQPRKPSPNLHTSLDTTGQGPGVGGLQATVSSSQLRGGRKEAYINYKL